MTTYITYHLSYAKRGSRHNLHREMPKQLAERSLVKHANRLTRGECGNVKVTAIIDGKAVKRPDIKVG